MKVRKRDEEMLNAVDTEVLDISGNVGLGTISQVPNDDILNN
jgi:hypothetical protein